MENTSEEECWQCSCQTVEKARRPETCLDVMKEDMWLFNVTEEDAEDSEGSKQIICCGNLNGENPK